LSKVCNVTLSTSHCLITPVNTKGDMGLVSLQPVLQEIYIWKQLVKS